MAGNRPERPFPEGQAAGGQSRGTAAKPLGFIHTDRKPNAQRTGGSPTAPGCAERFSLSTDSGGSRRRPSRRPRRTSRLRSRRIEDSAGAQPAAWRGARQARIKEVKGWEFGRQLPSEEGNRRRPEVGASSFLEFCFRAGHRSERVDPLCSMDLPSVSSPKPIPT